MRTNFITSIILSALFLWLPHAAVHASSRDCKGMLSTRRIHTGQHSHKFDQINGALLPSLITLPEHKRLLSGFEVTRFSLRKGLVLEIRRPRHWYGEKLDSPIIAAGIEEQRAFATETTQFAMKEFARRNWGDFIETRIDAALKNIPESTTISIYDESTGTLMGTVRLMNYPYAIRNGKIIPGGQFGRDLGIAMGSAFRDVGEHPTIDFPLPKLKTAMEDYLQIELPRLDPETVALSLANPDVTYERIYREIANLAIDKNLPIEIHDEVWAELFTGLTQEILRGDLEPDLKAPIVTYGDEASKHLYAAPGFKHDPRFGVITKHKIQWEVLLGNTENLLLFNHLLHLRGLKVLRSDRIGELYREHFQASPMITEATSYTLLQSPKKLYADFLTPGDPRARSGAELALAARLRWIRNRPRDEQPKLTEEVDRILETLKKDLEGGVDAILYTAADLLYQGQDLPAFKTFFVSEEFAATALRLMRKYADAREMTHPLHGDRIAWAMLALTQFGPHLRFDEVWPLYVRTFRGLRLQSPSQKKALANLTSQAVGIALHRSFRGAGDPARAWEIIHLICPFIAEMQAMPLSNAYADYVNEDSLTTQRRLLLSWYKTQFGELPESCRELPPPEPGVLDPIDF